MTKETNKRVRKFVEAVIRTENIIELLADNTADEDICYIIETYSIELVEQLIVSNVLEEI